MKNNQHQTLEKEEAAVHTFVVCKMQVQQKWFSNYLAWLFCVNSTVSSSYLEYCWGRLDVRQMQHQPEQIDSMSPATHLHTEVSTWSHSCVPVAPKDEVHKHVHSLDPLRRYIMQWTIPPIHAKLAGLLKCTEPFPIPLHLISVFPQAVYYFLQLCIRVTSIWETIEPNRKHYQVLTRLHRKDLRKSPSSV